MSVESFVIAALIEEGSPKKAYQANVSLDDFTIYDDEFKWIERRTETRKPINKRIFLERFPDFEWTPSKEDTVELIEELKTENAYRDFRAVLDIADTELTPDNVVDIAGRTREQLSHVLRLTSPHADVFVGADYEQQLTQIERLREMRRQGEQVTIQTGIENIDHHWDGLVPGRLIVTLGRPGEGKSYLLAKFAWEAKKRGYRVGFFSPEMSAFEHRCRIHTMASADTMVQEALGLRASFRNRALMRGEGFPLKRYKKFLKWFSNTPGEIIILTQMYRREKMTTGYIESKIEDLELDLVIIDPIYKLRPPRRRGNKVEELQDITDAIEDMAETYNIPIVISNQAGRHLGRADATPGRDSSFGSDAPVQEGDHVIGVLYDEEEHMLFLSCSKSRFGQKFNVKMKFYPNIGLMKELTPVKDDEYYNGHEEADEEKLRELLDSTKELVEDE